MYRCFTGKWVDLEVRNVQVFQRERGSVCVQVKDLGEEKRFERRPVLAGVRRDGERHKNDV